MIVRVLVIIASLASLAVGQVTIDLPLKGYYRIGQYMPIAVAAPASAQLITIEGDGIVPLRIEAMGRGVNDVFPLLILSTPLRTLSVDVDGQKQTVVLPLPLRVPAEDERLVAFVGAIADVEALRWFRDTKIVRINLKPSDALSGKVEAWESLDGALFDSLPAELNKSPDVLTRLAAQGVLIAIRTDERPINRWPWQHDGLWWVLHYEPAGPMTSLSPFTFSPITTNFADYVKPEIRRQVIGDAVIIAILALGGSLLPSRRKAVLALLLGVPCVMLLVGIWAAHRPAGKRLGGDVCIEDGSLVQTDNWEYQTTTTTMTFEAAMHQECIARPMLMDPQHAQRLELRMHCYVGGPAVYFGVTTGRDRMFVVLSRSIEPAKKSAHPRTDSTSLHVLARDAYPGCRIVGDHPAKEDEESLGVVFLQKAPTTKP